MLLQQFWRLKPEQSHFQSLKDYFNTLKKFHRFPYAGITTMREKIEKLYIFISYSEC